MELSDWLDQAYQQCFEHVHCDPSIGLRFKQDTIEWLRDEVAQLEDRLEEPTIIHLSHGLTLTVTPKHKLLCFNPNDNDRAAREMWLAHTEERLRENVRLRLITKGD